MGCRFRRKISILPGLYINVSKSGLSFSAGVRGASATFGNKRRYIMLKFHNQEFIHDKKSMIVLILKEKKRNR